MNFATGRPTSLAPNGMVSSPHSLASEAGVDVLRAGGSAVDAAIAAVSVLSVVYPHMTSVGGDAFWLIYDAKQRKVRYLNGGGRAAASGTMEWFRARGHAEIPLKGPLPATLTVPGAVASWEAAHATYGRLPLRRDLQSAIDYARDGFPVSARLARFIASSQVELASDIAAATLLLPDGHPATPGRKIAHPALARTLTAIADEGRAGFYEGAVGRELARYAAAAGGFFTASDLAAQRAVWGEPIQGRYRGVTIFETPPPTQGFTVIEMLNLLAPLGLDELDLLGAERAHLMIQAKQIAYNDRDRLLGDPAFTPVPIEQLLSHEYSNTRRTLLDPQRALPWDRIPSYGSLAGDTVFVAAVDRDGNAAALIQSLYGVFGAGVIAGDTGVILQNRSSYFSLEPSHPNHLEPGKVPLHTLIASIAVRDDKLWAVLGCMGADGQPQIHLQTYLAMIDHGLDIQQALEAPRWLSGRFALGEPRDTLHIEARFPAATIDALERRGHIIDRWGDWNEFAGHAHGITIDPVSGIRCGGSDPRSDGAAIGY